MIVNYYSMMLFSVFEVRAVLIDVFVQSVYKVRKSLVGKNELVDQDSSFVFQKLLLSSCWFRLK